MNNDMWQQLNENDENKKTCCSLQNRKSRVVFIVVVSVLAVSGVAVVIAFLIVFIKIYNS